MTALSRRQLVVLRLLAMDRSISQIASALRVNRSSAREHIAAVLGVLGVATREDAVRVGRELGYVRAAGAPGVWASPGPSRGVAGAQAAEQPIRGLPEPRTQTAQRDTQPNRSTDHPTGAAR